MASCQIPRRNPAIFTLIEKKDKDERDFSNWRPISLINVGVKIGSKAIAKRLESVLPNITHYNQCAYVKGRTIFDAVRTIEDVMEFSERYNLEGRMICIDFKKAFKTSFWFWSIIFAMDSYILQQYLKLCHKQWFFYSTLCS